ncbi:MAG: hypothetical protein R3202_04920 [Candidatus Competibacterales bacterium]|nr:hypothetical protein [Candidatus Competibacterales bacterium]
MAHLSICAYRDVPNRIANLPALPNGGIYTGHHVIPDHCWYVTSGLRGRGDLGAFLIPGCKHYRTDQAPVIIVTADANGGKSREHGKIHDIFDPLEFNNKPSWTYEEALDAAKQSIEGNFGLAKWLFVKEEMEKYFQRQCGVKMDTELRAGEHSVHPRAPQRKSARFKPY